MSKLPIIRPVTTAYVDAWNALSAMPALVVAALLVTVTVSAAEYFSPLPVLLGTGFGLIQVFLLGVAQSFFMTPVMIAVHRFVVLGEVTPGYVLDPHQRRFQLFFGWLLALLTASSLPILMIRLSAGLPFGISFALELIMMIALIVVGLRLMILFPAIAVEASGANPRNAWSDTKGHAWRILFIVLLASVPTLAVALLVVFALGIDVRVTGSASAFVGLSVIAVTRGLVFIVCVAIASRLFQALADRLLREA